MKTLVIAAALAVTGCHDYSKVINVIEAEKPCRPSLSEAEVDPRPHCYEVYPAHFKIKRCIAKRITKCKNKKCIKRKVKKCLKRKYSG